MVLRPLRVRFSIISKAKPCCSFPGDYRQRHHGVNRTRNIQMCCPSRRNIWSHSYRCKYWYCTLIHSRTSLHQLVFKVPLFAPIRFTDHFVEVTKFERALHVLVVQLPMTVVRTSLFQVNMMIVRRVEISNMANMD